MNKHDIELLIKDLSARLYYGVIANVQYKDGDGWKTENREILGLYKDGQVYLDCIYTTIDCVKPYLRSMSSMTEEEFLTIYDMCWPKDIEFNSTYGSYWGDFKTKKSIPYFMYNSNQIDYLNSHHFDYRGLIEKGLAIEAPKCIYNN